VIWRRHHDDERVQLAEDARRVAGFADALVDKAARLGAEVPDGVDACTTVWRAWSARLGEWARGGDAQT